jgi:biopolymer transport protein ExbD
MRFYLRKRRQPPAIIIVALIDILIVLLIFLMVTTTVKQQQPALRLALPESSQAQKTGASENAPLVVSIDQQGNLRLGPDAKPVTLERLKQELQQALEKNPETRLAIAADKSSPWGQVVKVMDIAKQANLKSGMVNAFMKEAAKQ